MTTYSDIRLSDIIAPSFHELYRAVKNHKCTHYVLEGGRGSTKSSFVSIAVLLTLKRNPNCHALVLRKVGNTLRDSVFAQYKWAISMLGLDGEFESHVAPMELIYKPTGQRILFRGADDKMKIKSIKVPFGYIGITHFEEKDQFAGREEIRSILQSTMRGGPVFWNFETNNPPISASNWANKDSMLSRPDRIVHKSTYKDVPIGWLGEQFIYEAELLRKTNERAYLHEYMGIPVGTGSMVFDNIECRKLTDTEIYSFDRKYQGIDWGYYPDPFAWNHCYYDTARQTLYIFDELTCYRMGNRQTADKLLERSIDKEEIIIADSAEPKSIGDYKDYGFTIKGVYKFPGSVAYTLKWLQSLKKIVIDPDRCPDTAEEFLNYEYEKTNDGEIISGYPDSNNHHIDAVRYALYPVWRKKGQ